MIFLWILGLFAHSSPSPTEQIFLFQNLAKGDSAVTISTSSPASPSSLIYISQSCRKQCLENTLRQIRRLEKRYPLQPLIVAVEGKTWRIARQELSQSLKVSESSLHMHFSHDPGSRFKKHFSVEASSEFFYFSKSIPKPRRGEIRGQLNLALFAD